MTQHTPLATAIDVGRKLMSDLDAAWQEAEGLRDVNRSLLAERNRLREINAELLVALKRVRPTVERAAKDAKAGWVEQRRVGLYDADLMVVDAVIARAEGDDR